MSSPDGLSGQLFSISAGFAGDENLSATPTRLCQLAVDAIPACDFAGITLLQRGKPTTAVFTDPESPEIDSAQYETGKGPCLDAFRDGVAYFIEDTRTEGRWPEFAATADEHGIRSTLSLSLNVVDNTVGALNMYAHEVNAFSDDDCDATRLYATQAAAVITNA